LRKDHAPAGELSVLEATFVPVSGNWLLYAAVQRALAIGGWPPRVFARHLAARALTTN